MATDVMLAAANRGLRDAFPDRREMWAFWRTRRALIARRKAAAVVLAERGEPLTEQDGAAAAATRELVERLAQIGP